MKGFVDSPKDAARWPSLPAAVRALDAAFEFGSRHQLHFVKLDAAGRLQAPRAAYWACEIFSDGRRLGWVAPFRMVNGVAVYR